MAGAADHEPIATVSPLCPAQRMIGVGLDGCKAGWIAIALGEGNAFLGAWVSPDVAHAENVALSTCHASAMVIDIPIGIPTPRSPPRGHLPWHRRGSTDGLHEDPLRRDAPPLTAREPSRASAADTLTQGRRRPLMCGRHGQTRVIPHTAPPDHTQTMSASPSAPGCARESRVGHPLCQRSGLSQPLQEPPHRLRGPVGHHEVHRRPIASRRPKAPAEKAREFARSCRFHSFVWP